MRAIEVLSGFNETSDEDGVIPLSSQRDDAIAMLQEIRPSEEPAVLLREDGGIRLRWAADVGQIPAAEFSLTYMPDRRIVAAWRDASKAFGLAVKDIRAGEERETLALSGMESMVLRGIRPSARSTAVERSLSDRIVRLEELIEQACETLDRNSVERALIFLDALGPTRKRPSAFGTHAGRFRIIWSTPTGDPVQEQFAVSFTGTGEAIIVYSDPDAPRLDSPKRHSGGGLVAMEIGEDEVMDVLRSSGLEEYVRDGVLPERGKSTQSAEDQK